MKRFVLVALLALATCSAAQGKDSPALTLESPAPLGPPTVTSTALPLYLDLYLAPLTPLPGPLFPLEAIDMIENAFNTGGYLFIPPDPIGAVSETHLVNIVNVSIEWYQRSTGYREHSQKIGDSDGLGFFAPLDPVNFLFDPKVIYDQYTDRFLAVALERQETGVNPSAENTSRILLAVSDDADPNGSWCFQALEGKLELGGIDYWADYPGFAVDEDAVYITASEYAFAPRLDYAGPYLWILPKGAGTGGFYDCGVSTVWRGDPGGFDTTTQPAHVFGAGGLPQASGTSANPGTYLVQYSGLSNGVDEAVNFILVDDPLGGPLFSEAYALVGDIDDTAVWMPDAPQLDTGAQIETNDRRALNAVWRNNRLWTTAQVVPPAGSDAGQATAHWWEFDTTGILPSAITLVQQGDIGAEDVAAQAHSFYPSIAVNGDGDAAIGFSVSAPSIYPSAAYTLREAGDPAGTVQNSVVYAAGTDWYRRTFGTGSNRWGDYSGMVVDVNDEDFCVYNEYAITRDYPSMPGNEDGVWGTRWACFGLGAPPEGADLELSKVQVTEIARRGQPIEYRITVTNNGPETAQDVTVTDTVSKGASFYSFDPICSLGPGRNQTTLICYLGDLAATQTEEVTVTLVANKSPVENTAQVSAASPDDPVPANNVDTVTTILSR